MAVSELVVFNGGLSTKTSPHLIERNQGVICQNVNLEIGTLKPFDNMLKLTDDNNNDIVLQGRYAYAINGRLYSNTDYTDDRFYDTYNGITYFSNANYGSNGLMKFKYNSTSGLYDQVSADLPNALTETQLSKIVMSQATNTDGLGQLTELATYVYAFTIVDSFGIESLPMFKESNVSIDKNNGDLSINMKMVKSDWLLFPQDSTLNIYRTGGNNPTFNLIAENLSPSSPLVIEDSTHYIYRDITADIDVSRIEIPTNTTSKPVENLDNLIEVQGTFFGSSGTKVYFSQQGRPEQWNQLDYVVLDKACTGLGKFSNSIVAFTISSAYIITGTNRDNISMQRLPFNQGCLHKHSIVNIDIYLLWTSQNGICLYDGSQVQVITKKTLAWDEFGRLTTYAYKDYDSNSLKWDTSIGFDIKYAIGYQDKYYGVYNDGIAVIDLSNGLVVSTISVPNVASLLIDYNDNFLYVIVEIIDSSGNYTDTYNVYAMITTGSKMEATWKTGRLSEGTTNVAKHYRKVIVDGEPISISVFVDGKLKHTSSNSKFMLPASCIGRDIQFEIKTVNEIRGIKYEYSQLKA